MVLISSLPCINSSSLFFFYHLLQDVAWRDEGDDDDMGISEEDILAFKAQQVEVESQRLKLRQNLRQRFELRMSQHCNFA